MLLSKAYALNKKKPSVFSLAICLETMTKLKKGNQYYSFHYD